MKKNPMAPSFLDKISTNLTVHNLLAPEDPVIIGLSGGPDSMALAYGLLQLKQRGRFLGEIYLAHLIHPFREDSAFDRRQEERCRAFAKTSNLSLSIQKIDVLSLHKAQGGSLENLGRRARYDFFSQVASQMQCTHIALAHQRDDQVETILHRLMRGAGWKGLRGIPWKRKMADRWIVRPLLNISRKEIIAYLEKEGVEYITDDLPADLRFFRNRLRYEILPYLKGFQPQMDQRLLDLGSQSTWTYEWMEGEVQKLRQQIPQDPFGAFVIPLSMIHLPPALLSSLVVSLLEELGTQPSFGEIYQFLQKLGDPQLRWTFGQGVCVEAEKEGVAFFRPREISVGAPLIIPGTTEMGPGERIKITLEKGEHFLEKKAPHFARGWQKTVYLDRQKLPLPLRARRRRDGDRFYPLGAEGKSKVKKILIQKKIPRRIRDYLWVLEDGKGRIVAIEGVGISENVKVESTTREVVSIEFLRS